MSPAPIAAGSFSTWLNAMQVAISGRGEMDVPCGECNACCRAAYFIQVEAHEDQALTAIPEPLLFPAPGETSGDKVMGFNEQGQCPMLDKDQCSIYLARPRTCRVFDCRVFAATGVFPTEPEKAEVTARAQRWAFSYDSEDSEQLAIAVRAAGTFLRDHSSALQDLLPRNATQLAVLAVRIHDLFIGCADSDTTQLIERVRARIQA